MFALMMLSLGCVEPTPPNTAPSLMLLSPADNDVFSADAPASFEARVVDAEDPLRKLHVRWYSNRDGVLAESTTPDHEGVARFSAEGLSPGAHEIEALVYDTRGASAGEWAAITVHVPEQSPELERRLPLANDTAEAGVPVTFEALVSDLQDGPDALEVTVASDRLGTFLELSIDSTGLAQGAAPLSAGRHFLTYTVWDSDGHETIQTLALDVAPPDAVDHDGDGFSAADGDCADEDDTRHPDVVEVCDGIDNNCDGVVDEQTECGDDDGDGFSEEEGDCDDSTRLIYPGAAEVWYDGIDQDCAGDDDYDADGDGYRWDNVGWDDCDDSDPDSSPGSVEVCDGVDNDCDDEIDNGATTTFYPDHDGDGYGNPDYPIESCAAPSGYVSDGTDCYDYNAAAWPGSTATSSRHRGDGSWDYDCSE